MNETSKTKCIPEEENISADETNYVLEKAEIEVDADSSSNEINQDDSCNEINQDNSSNEINQDDSFNEINQDDFSNEINEDNSSDTKEEDSSVKMNFSDGVQIDITPEKNGGVLKKIIKTGEGEEYPGYGDRVFVHYTGWLLGKDLKEFDSNRKEEKFEFNLGRGIFFIS